MLCICVLWFLFPLTSVHYLCTLAGAASRCREREAASACEEYSLATADGCDGRISAGIIVMAAVVEAGHVV